MSAHHLSMTELLAVRDTDRSEPAFAMAHRHVDNCGHCRAELDRLHQRVAQLRALPTLAPGVNVYPRVQRQIREVRAQRHWRSAATFGIAAAAALVVWVVGSSVASPPTLSAEAQIADVKSSAQRYEERLVEWAPAQRALDGGTVIVVIQLEDRLADNEREIDQVNHVPSASRRVIIKLSQDPQEERLHRELELWREREGLLKALLNVHVTRKARIDL